MIVIVSPSGTQHVFAIVPDDDPELHLMRADEPDWVELISNERIAESGHPVRWELAGIGLETAEATYRGTARWVCPD